MITDIGKRTVLNGPLSNLEGKVVVFSFWTYSDINCLEIVDLLNWLYENQLTRDLVVFAVHTPEFGFEKEPDNVRAAMERLSVKFPVILDPEYDIWAAFNNQYWPSSYLFDRSGDLVDEAVRGENFHTLIEKVLILSGSGNTIPSNPISASRSQIRMIYLGGLRGEIGNAGDHGSYRAPDSKNEGIVYLDGKWKQAEEYLESGSGSSRLLLWFSGNELNVMASRRGKADIKCVIDNRETEITVNLPDAYRLFQAKDKNRHSVILTVPEGVRLYAFSCRQD